MRPGRSTGTPDPSQPAFAAGKPATTGFIQVNDPSDGSWRRVVRSHAARSRHASARRKRVIEHQQQQALAAGLENVNRELRIVKSPENLTIRQSVDIFDTLPRPTNRYECFLMDYFIKNAPTTATIPVDAANIVFERTGKRMNWMQATIMDPTALGVVFLTSCRFLVQAHATGDYWEKALVYRGECIRSITSAIEREGSSPTAGMVLVTLGLALDALMTGDIVAAKGHCNAARSMVRIEHVKKRFEESETLSPLPAFADQITEHKLFRRAFLTYHTNSHLYTN